MHTYCSHKITLFKLEKLCMHFLSAMLYSVDARMFVKTVLRATTQVGYRNRSRQVIKPERYEYAANRRIDGPECSLILGQYV